MMKKIPKKMHFWSNVCLPIMFKFDARNMDFEQSETNQLNRGHKRIIFEPIVATCKTVHINLVPCIQSQ